MSINDLRILLETVNLQKGESEEFTWEVKVDDKRKVMLSNFYPKNRALGRRTKFSLEERRSRRFNPYFTCSVSDAGDNSYWYTCNGGGTKFPPDFLMKKYENDEAIAKAISNGLSAIKGEVYVYEPVKERAKKLFPEVLKVVKKIKSMISFI